MRIGFAGALALALLSACATDYPAGWSRVAPVATVGACPRLAGLYSDAGTQSDNPGDLFPGPCDAGWHCSLGTYLFYTKLPRIESVLTRKIFPERPPTEIEIIQADGVLEAVAWHGTGSTRRKLQAVRFTKEQGEFTCTAEGIKLKRLSGGIGAVGGGGAAIAAVEREDRTLNRGEDGHLVLKVERGAWGIVIFVPAMAFSTSWYRWKPAPASSP
jgi:hypothetical protein